MPPLGGLRVLELAQGLAGPYAGMMLADQGAEVTKIEPPGGGSSRGTPAFRVLDRGKRSAVIDPASAGDRELLVRLALASDVVLVGEEDEEPFGPTIAYEALARRAPQLIWCAAPTFPKGSRFAGLPADDRLAAATCGMMSAQPGNRDGPVFTVLPIASYAAGILAAGAVMAALRVRDLTGRGQRVVVPVFSTGSFLVGPTTSDKIVRTLVSSPAGSTPAYRLYKASDDWLVIACTNPDFFARLCVALGRPDILADSRFELAPWGIPPDDRQVLIDIFTEIFSTRTRSEWLATLHEHDVPAAAVETRSQYLASELVAANRMMVEIEDPEVGATRQIGAPVRLDGVAERPRGPAPQLDAAREAVRADGTAPPRAVDGGGSRMEHPLDGIRVLDFTEYLGGPVCGLLLAELGAEVIKVERLTGEGLRSGGITSIGFNRGKRALAVDMKTPKGREIIADLVRRSDVVLEGFRPGVTARVGLDTETLMRLNPRVVHGSITGYGDYEPYWSLPSFDPILQALSGQMRAQGGEGHPPVFAATAQNDFSAGFLTLFGILVQLWRRESTGAGGRVEVSQAGAALAFQAVETVEYAGRPSAIPGAPDLLGASPIYRLFEASDGWLFVGAKGADEWRGLCAALGDGLTVEQSEAARGGPPDGPLGQRLAALFRRRPVAEWVSALSEQGVPAAPIVDVSEAGPNVPEFTEVDLVAEMEHRIFGHLTLVKSPMRFSTTPMVVGRPTPWVGEDNRAILSELGRSEDEIESLYADKVVGTLPDPPLL